MKILTHNEDCPVCQSQATIINKKYHDYLRLRSYHKIYTCKKCTHSWRYPKVSEDKNLLNRYELDLGDVIYGSYTGGHENNQHLVPKHLIERAKLVKEQQIFLDFGVGNGDFLDFLINKKINAYGVEIDENYRKCLRKYVKKDIEQFNDSYFDYIHAHHVIEHVVEPLDTFKDFHRKLKDKGKILIEVPNELNSAKSIIKRILNIKSNSATSLYEHQHYFTPKSLEVCIKRSGFKLENIKTPRRINNGFIGFIYRFIEIIKKGDVIFITATK